MYLGVEKHSGSFWGHLVLLALQVLSNEETRAKYDQSGRAGLDVSVVDSMQFFGMLFGSEAFEYLVGELKVRNREESKVGFRMRVG